MSDELDTAAKVGGGALGGMGVIGVLLRLLFGNLRTDIASLQADVAHLRERIDKSNEVRNAQLAKLETRVGRLEGRAGVIGDGAAEVES